MTRHVDFDDPAHHSVAALKEGIGLQLLLNILLTLIGWLPGVIHAFWIQTRGSGGLDI